MDPRRNHMLDPSSHHEPPHPGAPAADTHTHAHADSLATGRKSSMSPPMALNDLASSSSSSVSAQTPRTNHLPPPPAYTSTGPVATTGTFASPLPLTEQPKSTPARPSPATHLPSLTSHDHPSRRSSDGQERDKASDVVLPPLSSLTGGSHPRDDTMMLNQPNAPAPLQPQWAQLNPVTTLPSPVAQPHHQTHHIPNALQDQVLRQQVHRLPYHNHRPSQSIGSPSAMDIDTAANSMVSMSSPDPAYGSRASSVTLDDPGVRVAAEALGALRADFLSSPSKAQTPLPMSPPTQLGATMTPQSSQPEPLLALLTTSHPLLATTIGGATSAYGGAKNFSPRFKSSAEYVEGYLSPIANTMGSVGRVTGVEGGMRWFLGSGRRHNTSSSDHEVEGNSKKRRKTDFPAGASSNKRFEAGEMRTPSDSIPSTPGGDRRSSVASTVDTLPAYDDIRSPAYTETTVAQTPRSTNNGAWQSRLIVSTSGLGVAMSSESLRSLKFCLQCLRWANEHMSQVMDTLKTTLEQYERAGDSEMARVEGGNADGSTEQDQHQQGTQPTETRGELAERINALKGDVLKTLQEAISTVSKYAGGALPENAKMLVRRHLTSLPQRFRVATMSQAAHPVNGESSDSAIHDGAQKVLVLAKEGLDMVVQVSGVVNSTIVNAEEWLDRMGRRRESLQEPQPAQLPSEKPTSDVDMS